MSAWGGPMTVSRRARLGRICGVVAGLALATFAALDCGSSGGSKFTDSPQSPCSAVYKGLCGVTCATDGECPSGLYCGLNRKCNADCAAGYDCASGLTCSPRGRCGVDFVGRLGDANLEDDGPVITPDAFCAATDVTLDKVVPKVLFLLDQSSSMYLSKFPTGDSNGCNPDCRWTVLKDVLIGPDASPGGLVKELEDQAEIGLQLYSATDAVQGDDDDSFLSGPTDDVCPRFNGKAFAGLAFQLNAYASVNALLRPAGVDDDTPTGPAIRTVVGLSDDGGVGSDAGFAAMVTNAPKVLVLVTDGEPGVCGDNSPSDPGRLAVVRAVQDSFQQSIKTFVIAIGDTSTEAQAHFNAVANAGQGLDPQNGDAGAIQPSTPQALLDALKQIVLDARTCAYDLQGEVVAGKEKEGTVTLNGAPVPYDDPGAPDEGWRLVNPSRIELVGTACATLKATPGATLSARFPCGAVTVRQPK